MSGELGGGGRLTRAEWSWDGPDKDLSAVTNGQGRARILGKAERGRVNKSRRCRWVSPASVTHQGQPVSEPHSSDREREVTTLT